MRTAVASATPDPYQELADLLNALLAKKARSAFTPNYWPWHEIPGMVQIRMAVWDPERGWLTTRRGITHAVSFMDRPYAELDENVVREVRAGLRAMQAAWRKR